MIRSAVTVAAFLLCAAQPAAADDAVLRGVAYVCDSAAPISGAHVRLTNLDERRSIVIDTTSSGRFSRVGLTPGPYLIELLPIPPWGKTGYLHASRVARLEAGDALDMRIGAEPARIIQSGRASRTGVDAYPLEPRPQPACDDPIVPPAPPLTDRYIIR